MKLTGVYLAVFWACLEAPFCVRGDVAGDIGSWNFSDCIMAQFEMEFKVFVDRKNLNKTLLFDVPKSAELNSNISHCGDTNQTLGLIWKTDDDSIFNKLTITFSAKPDEVIYGVSRFYAELTVSSSTVNGTVQRDYVTIDSGDLTDLMFHTPNDRSFLCADIGDLRVKTTITQGGNLPRELNSTEVIGRSVRFDAFRTKDHSPPSYRTPMDCDYVPNDIVPIAVGVALAVLVVVVLVAYLVGRKRHRQRGYQSL